MMGEMNATARHAVAQIIAAGGAGGCCGCYMMLPVRTVRCGVSGSMGLADDFQRLDVGFRWDRTGKRDEQTQP